MAKKLTYTKTLGNAVSSAARDIKIGKYHVISAQTGRWAVVSEGATRPMRAFATQRAAVTFAKQYVVSNSTGEVVIHAKDGKIRDRITI